MEYLRGRVRARVLEAGLVEEGLPAGPNHLVHPKTLQDHPESQHLNPLKWNPDLLANRGLLLSESHEALLHINLQVGHLRKTEVILQRALHLKKGLDQTVDHLKDPKVLNLMKKHCNTLINYLNL